MENPIIGKWQMNVTHSQSRKTPRRPFYDELYKALDSLSPVSREDMGPNWIGVTLGEDLKQYHIYPVLNSYASKNNAKQNGWRFQTATQEDSFLIRKVNTD